jgi:hypothetical protein
MAARTRFALVFWMAVAVAVAILGIRPWTGAPGAQSSSASPIAAREIIYRPQPWNVYCTFGKRSGNERQRAHARPRRSMLVSC